MLVKIWLNDDCRRFSCDPAVLNYKLLRAKVKQIYQLDQDESFILKYKDEDGDLVTVSNAEELNEIIENDIKTSNFVFKLFVFLTYTPNAVDLVGEQSAENTLDAQAIDVNRPKFGTDFSDREIVDILRDISYYIAARDMAAPGVNSWVSSERSLITPNNVPTVNRNRHSRVVRSKIQAPDEISFANAPSSWTIFQVATWLSTIGYDEYVPYFQSNDINGEILLDLTHDTLKELGMISTGKRIRLLKFIQELKIERGLNNNTNDRMSTVSNSPMKEDKRARNFSMAPTMTPGSKFGTVRSKAGMTAGSIINQIQEGLAMLDLEREQVSPTKRHYGDMYPERC